MFLTKSWPAYIFKSVPVQIQKPHKLLLCIHLISYSHTQYLFSTSNESNPAFTIGQAKTHRAISDIPLYFTYRM